MVLALVGGLSCAAPLDEGIRLTSDPALDWSEPRVRAHLQYLDGEEVEGRQTASRGFTRAAAYVAGQMRDMGLQPVLTGEYRLQYPALISRIVRSEVLFADPDTSVWLAGNEYLLTGDATEVDTVGRGRNLPGYPFLEWKAGLEDDLGPTGVWSLRLQEREQVTSAPMNVMGIIPGADPVRRDSLVVLMAPLDGFGLQREESWTDGTDLSIPAAALLESTRRLALIQQRWARYPYSVMVIFLSGTLDRCQGLEMALRHFPWDLTHVVQVEVLRMQMDARCGWRARIANAGISPTIVNELAAYSPFSEEAEFGFGAWRPRSEAQRTDQLDVAVDEALRLSRELMPRIP